MRRTLALFAASALALFARAEPTAEPAPALKDAVILIIRHAEKPASGNTLSPAGEERARAYAAYFQKFTLDSEPMKPDELFAAADSQNSHRPRLTLEPLAHALGTKIDTRFKDKDAQALASELRSGARGRHILICWHHGQIPELLRALGADPGRLLPQAGWPSETFDWVIALRYDHEGRLVQGEERRINEHLLPGDPN